MVFKLRKPSPGRPRFAAEWLVVGLGNPGEQYAPTRHNVGFRVVNELAKRARTQPRAAGSTMYIGVGDLGGTRVALVRPRTFVNLSGKAVAQALQWTGADIRHTIVVYDELDLPVGALRVRAGGGHGGHNGLKSIGQAVGLDFVRVRVGIGRPTSGGEPSWDPDVVADWVLSSPGAEDRPLLEESTRLAANAIDAIIHEGADSAAGRFNRTRDD